MRHIIIGIIAAIAFLVSTQAAFATSLIRDAEIEHTLRMYADPIFKSAGLNPSSIKLFIVNDDSLNAYVAGGANMFIHTGLILATNTPDMLLGVMAHETGHIAGGHLAKGAEQLKNAQLGTIMTFVLGAAAAAATKKPEAAAAVLGGGQNTVARNFFAYTRANEEAADQAALRYLDKLNISAGGMADMFALLQRNERQHFGTPDPYMLTHPLSASRIDHVRNHVETSPITNTAPSTYALWHKRMQAKLYAFMESPERTFQKYPLSDKSLSARLAHAIAYYKMPDMPKALDKIDGMLAESKNDAYLYDLKGQMLFENGHTQEALTAYEQATKLVPDSALILSDLAKTELALNAAERSQSAITHLEKATSMDGSNANAWRLLATAYGKINNKGMASLALAEEAALHDDIQSALAQVEQALASLANHSPAYQRAQDLKARLLSIKDEKDKEESPF